MNAPRDDDAQRTLEQHALRNVRTLVDKLGYEDAVDRRKEKKIVIGLCIFAAVVAGGLVAGYTAWKSGNKEVSRCEVDAAADVVYEWRREAKARDPSVTAEQLEKTISVVHANVKAEAAKRCAGATPAK